MPNGQSRNEDILMGMQVEPPLSRVEALLIDLINSGGGGTGGGGTPGVSAFNGRRGNVLPQRGDYTADKINTSRVGKTAQDYFNEFEAAQNLDAALSGGSTRAVQNKVVTQAIDDLQAKTVPPGGNTGDILTKGSSASYDTQWTSASVYMRKSEYDANQNGRVDKAEVAYNVQGATYKAALKNTTGDTYLLTEQDKGVRNGVVPLDSTGKILPQYLPDSIMNGLTNGGIFNADTRTVTLSDAAKDILHVTSDTLVLENTDVVPAGYPANAELYYITTVGGVFAGMNFTTGDWLISLGNQWQQLVNGNQVSSVQGQTGAVLLDSDDVPQGRDNLYMTAAERAKLAGIEEGATKDQNVVQKASILYPVTGGQVLRLEQKNGSIIDFAGGGAIDDTQYLKKTGDASETTVIYGTAMSRVEMPGGGTLRENMALIRRYLNDLKTIAFTGRYADLEDEPTKLSQFLNDGNGNVSRPFITQDADNLANYYKKADTYTKREIDNLIAGLDGHNYIVVDALPTTDIDETAIYYVPIKDGATITGYNRWQRIRNEWVFLGTTDIHMSEYLKKDGDGSNVTSSIDAPVSRLNLVSGEKISVSLGKIARWLQDLKTVAFTGSFDDLTETDDVVLRPELDDYVKKDQGIASAGKVLGVGADGKVTTVTASEGVVRRGNGALSVVGNDDGNTPVNDADGDHSTAFGDHTIAKGAAKFVAGRYNRVDTANNYAEQIGGGDINERRDLRNTTWDGKGWYYNGVSVGNTTDHIVEIQNSNDLTTKAYVDRTIDEEIAKADLLRSMVVAVVPELEDAENNVLYLVPDPTTEGHYNQFKKVLKSQNPDVYEMANLGGTQLSVQGSQVERFPTPSAAYAGKVYQYVGTSSDYIKGASYVCTVRPFYGWLRVGDEDNVYYTEHVPVVARENVYRSTALQIVALAKEGDNTTFVDGLGNNYTRNRSADLTSYYQWTPLLTKTSELTNDGHGTNEPGDVYMTKAEYDAVKPVKTSDLMNNGNGTGNAKDEFVSKVDLLNMIYPVGSIYVSVNNVSPAMFLGGEWQAISDGYYLRASSSGAGNTLDAQLPNVTGSFRFSSGSQGHPEVSSPTGAFKTASNGNLTYPWPTDGTSGGPRTVNFSLKYFNNDLYVDNGTVQPKSLKVYMWKRVADKHPVTGISLSTTDLHIRVGSISRVVVTVTPSNADNPAYTITSSDTTIAVPEGDYGIIRAKKIGTTTVRVKSVSNPEVYKDCTITVEPSDWAG